MSENKSQLSKGGLGAGSALDLSAPKESGPSALSANPGNDIRESPQLEQSLGGGRQSASATVSNKAGGRTQEELQSLSVRQYLDATVVPIVLQAMAEVSK